MPYVTSCHQTLEKIKVFAGKGHSQVPRGVEVGPVKGIDPKQEDTVAQKLRDWLNQTLRGGGSETVTAGYSLVGRSSTRTRSERGAAS